MLPCSCIFIQQCCARYSPLTCRDSSEKQNVVEAFLHVVSIEMPTLADRCRVLSAHFVIAPQWGGASRPINGRYAVGNLDRRGYIDTGSEFLPPPVFGLFAGFENHLIVDLQFTDQSTQSFDVSITAAPYTDPNRTGWTPVTRSCSSFSIQPRGAIRDGTPFRCRSRRYHCIKKQREWPAAPPK